MTDLDAISISVLDLHESIRRMNKQQQSDPVEQFISFLVHRILPVSKHDRRSLSRQISLFDPKKGYPSHRIAIIALSTIKLSSSSFGPESLRAFLIWLTGEDEEPGYAGALINSFPDKNSERAVKGIKFEATKHLERNKKRDMHIFGLAQKRLSRHSWRIIKNLLHDGSVSRNEDDGVTASQRTASARQVALSLLLNQKNKEKWEAQVL